MILSNPLLQVADLFRRKGRTSISILFQESFSEVGIAVVALDSESSWVQEVCGLSNPASHLL